MTATEVDITAPVPVKPFLRWVGGKAKLVDQIKMLLPTDWRVRTYHEPFLGGGSLFFALQPKRAVLSDLNTRLTRTYTAIQSDPTAVLDALAIYAAAYMQHGVPFYDHARGLYSDEMSNTDVAAWFIFMNKTNFNGVWRVNSRGGYNVPAGTFKTPPKIVDEPTIIACAEALQHALVINDDFRAVERRAAPGDVVYFDPPYVPVSTTADFTAYTAEGFEHANQVALRDLALRLKRSGVHVVLSNSSAPLVRELYKDFDIHEVAMRRSINSDTTKRAAVTELLIR